MPAILINAVVKYLENNPDKVEQLVEALINAIVAHFAKK